MAFPEPLIQAAWRRSGGQCECTSDGHGHGKRCGTRLLSTLQAAEGGAGRTASRRASWGTDVLANCEIRCTRCQRPQVAPNRR
jgi:hypothetical protein